MDFLKRLFFKTKFVKAEHNWDKDEYYIEGVKWYSFVITFVLIPLVWSSFYITQEGYRGVERKLGEVTIATEPGLHFKLPIVETVDIIEIRPRKYELELMASTAGMSNGGAIELQMPSKVTITGNWSVDPEAVKDIVAKYGSIRQFEFRVLNPRVREATLAEFPKYTIEKVMTDRTTLSNNIYIAMKKELTEFPVIFSDMMVSDVDWHDKIKNAILSKQDAKLKKEEEEYRLEKQNLVAQQVTNTASAEAAGIDVKSVAEAAAIERKGLAEVAVMRQKAAILAKNPNLIQLVHEEKWNGSLITFSMTGDKAPTMLMPVPKVEK